MPCSSKSAYSKVKAPGSVEAASDDLVGAQHSDTLATQARHVRHHTDMQGQEQYLEGAQELDLEYVITPDGRSVQAPGTSERAPQGIGAVRMRQLLHCISTSAQGAEMEAEEDPGYIDM